MGADIRELPDGFVVRGGGRHRSRRRRLQVPWRPSCRHDAGARRSLARGETTIDGVECAGISFPGFAQILASGGARIEEA